MVYITRRVEFCASHRLYNPNFTDEENDALYGRCNNRNGHGHNYVLEVTVKGEVDAETGMVMDLKRLKTLLDEEIVARVDHMNLNLDVDFLQGVIPTAENIVVSFWQIIEDRLADSCQLHELRLWESENNMAFYRGEGAEIARHTALAGRAS
jgi:6-pyruvoyltetrahydropterin/6-carboxytetrahydropterin synthase